MVRENNSLVFLPKWVRGNNRLTLSGEKESSSSIAGFCGRHEQVEEFGGLPRGAWSEAEREADQFASKGANERGVG